MERGARRGSSSPRHQDVAAAPSYTVAAIHDDRGYTEVRRALARQYDPALLSPNLQVTGADLTRDRRLTLTHWLNDRVPLAQRDAQAVLVHVADLWGYDVELKGVGPDDAELYSYEASAAG